MAGPGKGRRSTLGWSDAALFTIFENGHNAIDQIYMFMSTIPEIKKAKPCVLKLS